MKGRRTVLLGLGAATGLGAVAIANHFQNQQQSAQPPLEDRQKVRDFTVVGKATLQERAANKGIIYGAAAQYKPLTTNKRFAQHFAQECAVLVPANELKWKTLRPTPEKFNFSRSDWMAEFAQKHNMLFRGHTLVWYQALPKWFEDKVNRKNAEKFLTEHINTVVQRYAGKIYSWDVVNEAILPNSSKQGLRQTPWLRLLGADYIEMAFRTAAAADPQALLIYNDNNLEYDNAKTETKRDRVLKLLERLKSKGVPIHGLGIQSHLGASSRGFNAKRLRNFLKDVASLDLQILITEMDVSETKLLVADDRDTIIAGVYHDYLSLALDEPAVNTVITWGLSDRYTWLSHFAPRQDGVPVRPLPLDAELERKLAWNAIASAFDQASPRNIKYNF
ncbi:endo-1,4-beta-xylanase [Chroogloeocystis siderophila]|jgi:endo-1,4-beta-xylanase|uniref:Beta-xylanase n=1 Tax=Chroogloeocystis siderophila 5.2 s.c.1 TaxID=247279 RepID=A0A1U7HVQ0_9CHRO|nr:endo-1,4-beta-xylanase [Chroogloeocystis siderophila]OKH27680.1 glycosyl hydrolase family 10 [Chroogloeocystis siderophila 5.2 s.c.1]